MKHSLFKIILTCFLPFSVAHGNSQRTGAWTPEKQAQSFSLAEGFVIELVASEEHGIINPIDLTFDDAGRLWTQTAEMYPLDPVTGINFGKALKMMTDPKLAQKFPKVQKIRDLYTLKTRGTDKILIMDEPHKAASGPLHVWADGLALPQSIYPYKDGCYVAHGSEFFFLRDTDGDGKQDTVETEMSGFGFFDTHTMAHSIVRAPGGWLNFTHGALNSGKVKLQRSGKEKTITYAKNLRYKMDGEELEVVGIARDNVWGYQLRGNGQWYATSANDNGLSVLPMEDQTAISGIGGDKIREYQPYVDGVHDFRVGGTGISGLAFSEDGAQGFPAEWEDVAFLANPITRTINCVRIKRHPSGKIEAEHLPDLLSCEDEWFRPVNLEMGPDGCLYIADWYNKIVSHNEVSTDHPDRDRSHGRIWRVRHVSQKPFPIANVAKAETSALINHLKDGKTLWEKRAAWQQITDRGAKELAPALLNILKGKENLPLDTVIHALWSLEGIKHFDEAVMKEILASTDGDLRREAIRSLASFQLPAETVADLVKPYVKDENAMVRSQVLRTLEEVGVANQDTISLLVSACHAPGLTKDYGAGYEQSFERFLARKALENYPKELLTYLSSPRSSEHPSSHILWATQALPADQRLSFFIDNWKKNSSGEIDEGTFTSMTELLDAPEMRKVVAPIFKNRTEEMIKLTLATRESSNLPKVTLFFRDHIEGLLNTPETLSEGLRLIKELSSPHHPKTLLKLLQKHPEKRTEIMSALGTSPGNIPASLHTENFKKKGASFTEKLDAVAALYVKDNKTASQLLAGWLPSLDPNQMSIMVKRLALNKQALPSLLKFTDQKKIDLSAWSSDLYSMFGRREQNSSAGKKLKAYLAQRSQKNKEERAQKIQQYTAAAQKLTGDVKTGQALFQSCLACHQVGENGVKVGPPLDGSANRDLEHLITAIVDPDAAVEGAYGLYYVAQHDGKVLEGMPKRKTPRGTTLISAGGAETFIPKHLIRSEGSFGKSSFMPKSFGSFSDQMMTDLVSYIMTLE